MTPCFPSATSDEIVKALIKIGFKFKRQSGGSHAIYYREADKRRTVVPIHSGKAVKRKTLKSILDSAGLTADDFERLRND